jgi:hypothetical protein
MGNKHFIHLVKKSIRLKSTKLVNTLRNSNGSNGLVRAASAIRFAPNDPAPSERAAVP